MKSAHSLDCFDQAALFAVGKAKDVNFTMDAVRANPERSYHRGDEIQ